MSSFRPNSSGPRSPLRRSGPAAVTLLSWAALILAIAALGGVLFWPEGSGALILLSALLPLILSGTALLTGRSPRSSGTLPTAAFILSALAALPITLVGGLHLLSAMEPRKPSNERDVDAVMLSVADRLSGTGRVAPLSDEAAIADRRARFQEMMRRTVAHYATLPPEEREKHFREYEEGSPRRNVRFAREMLLVETEPRLKVRLLQILDTNLSSTFAARYPSGPATLQEAEAISSEALTLARDLAPGMGFGDFPAPANAPPH